MSGDQSEPDLEHWLEVALDAAGSPEVDVSLRSSQAVTAILDLARHAAHGVTRPAAPLSTFALGLALGAGGGDVAALEDLAARIGSRARSWDGEEGS